jgi:malate dehydrogenase
MGIRELFVRVPVKLGAHGIEKIFEFKLTDDELAALHKKAAAVKELVDVMASGLGLAEPAAVTV